MKIAVNGTILVLNAGSSSIKFALFPADARPTRQRLLCDGEMAGIGHRMHFFAKDAAGGQLAEQRLDPMVIAFQRPPPRWGRVGRG